MKVGDVLHWPHCPNLPGQRQRYAVVDNKFAVIIGPPEYDHVGERFSLSACRSGRIFTGELTERESANYALAMMGIELEPLTEGESE